MWSKYRFRCLSLIFFLQKYCSYDLTLPCSLYKAELVANRVSDVDRMVEKGFAKWFKRHVSHYTLCL
jgi:hypothetical protein